MNSRADGWALLVLFAITAILQIALATRQSLWGDELFSIAIATGHSLEHPASDADPAKGDFVEPAGPVHPEELQGYLRHRTPPASPGQVIRAVSLSDTSPPLYYLLLYAWTIVFGTTDFAVRLFSILFSLASFPLLADVARRVEGRSAVLPACLLYALSPLALYFATEARMYSLLVFCVLATIWISLRLQQDGGSVLSYFAWTVSSAAGFLTHYFFLFPWVAIVAFLFLRPGRFASWRLLSCILLTGLVIVPWYLHVPESLSRWRVTGGWLHIRPKEYDAVRATRNQVVQFYSANGFGLWPYHRWSALAGVALFAGLLGTIAWRLRLGIFQGGRLLVCLWFLAACIAPSAMDVLQHTFLANNPRYVLAGLPAAYLIGGIALAGLTSRTRLLILVLIPLIWAPPLIGMFGMSARDSQPFRKVAQHLQFTAQPADLILVHSIPSGVLGVARYTKEPLEIASWVQPLGNRRVPESLQSLIAGRARVRYVKVHLLGEPLPEEEWLRAHATISGQSRSGQIFVTDFRPKNRAKF